MARQAHRTVTNGQSDEQGKVFAELFGEQGSEQENLFAEQGSEQKDCSPNNEERLYTAKEIAVILGVSDATIRTRWKDKLLEAYQHCPTPLEVVKRHSGKVPVMAFTEFGLEAIRGYHEAVQAERPGEHLQEVKQRYPNPAESALVKLGDATLDTSYQPDTSSIASMLRSLRADREQRETETDTSFSEETDAIIDVLVGLEREAVTDAEKEEQAVLKRAMEEGRRLAVLEAAARKQGYLETKKDLEDRTKPST